MAKGKLVLQDIQSPVEGMQVVHFNSLFEKYYLGEYWRPNNISHKSHHQVKWNDKNTTRNNVVVLSELKQIVVEYKTVIIGMKDDEAADRYNTPKVLPVHPDDWKWAIEHIGEEVEFEIKIDQSKNDWNGNAPEIAKLIHPTPVTYTQDECMVLCLNARDDIYKGNLDFMKWWDDHKKK